MSLCVAVAIYSAHTAWFAFVAAYMTAIFMPAGCRCLAEIYAAYMPNRAVLQMPHSGRLHSRCSAGSLKPC